MKCDSIFIRDCLVICERTCNLRLHDRPETCKCNLHVNSLTRSFTLLIAALIAAAVPSPAFAASASAIFGDKFAHVSVTNYLEHFNQKYTSFVTNDAGEKAISSADGGFSFRNVDVHERTKYRFAFTASRRGGADLAASISQQTALFGRNGSTPQAEIYFYDADGKELPRGLILPQSIHSETNEEYILVFHTPDRCAALSLHINNPRNNAVTISNVRFGPDTIEKTINVNPDFSLGIYNYCGVVGCNDNVIRMVRDKDGRIAFHTGFYCHTAAFPVKPGKTYKVEMEGCGFHKNRFDSFIIFNFKGKPPLTQGLPRVSRNSRKDPTSQMQYEFTAYDDMTWAHFWIYNATLYRIQVTEKD